MINRKWPALFIEALPSLPSYVQKNQSCNSNAAPDNDVERWRSEWQHYYVIGNAEHCHDDANDNKRSLEQKLQPLHREFLSSSPSYGRDRQLKLTLHSFSGLL